MAGRLAAAQLLAAMGKTELVMLSGVGAVAGAGILLATRAEWMLLVGAIVLGLSYASVFPTVLAIAGDKYRRMAGSVFGLLFAIALLGGMSFPWAVGQISQGVGVRYGMFVPLLGAVGICALAVAIVRREKLDKKL